MDPQRLTVGGINRAFYALSLYDNPIFVPKIARYLCGRHIFRFGDKELAIHIMQMNAVEFY